MQSGFLTSLSGRTAAAVILVLAYLTFNNGIPFILNWDVFGNHAYLPMAFNQGTLVAKDLSYFEAIQQQYQNTPNLYQFVSLENGNFMIKYTSGWAILMLPFYCIAELWAGLGHYPKDGFSFPYQAMIAFGAFAYTALGILVLRKVLLKFFSDRLSTAALLLSVFGTNYLFMQFGAMGMSHNLQFFLLALLILLTIQFHENPALGKGVQLGLVVGLIGLVRIPDLVFSLIPLGWNYKQYGGFLAKIKFFFQQHRKTTAATILAVIIGILPQIIYWKLVAGTFVMNSYANNPGEGFDWLTPYFANVLFSFKKGWLLYTPLMAFSIAGFFFWRRKAPGQGNVALLAFLVFFYVVSSWTTWWYAESFGSRAMEDIYPLLIIAFGFFLAGIKDSRSRLIFYPLIGLLVALNLFQTWQMTRGILDASRITKEYYLSVFGQTSAPTDAQRALLSINRGEASKKGFADKSGYRETLERTLSFGDFTLNKDTIYTPALDILPSDVTKKDHFWIVSTWKYEGPTQALNGKFFTTCAMYKGKSYNWEGNTNTSERFLIDTLKKEITVEYLSPNFRTSKDVVRVSAWNQSGDDLKIKSVRIQGYEKIH